MEKILKSVANEIWINNSNKILKERPFNEQPIQDGLVFWGSSDPNFLTLVGDKVAEAYDLRGTGDKMVQTVEVKRMTLSNNFLVASGIHYLQSTFTTSIRALFAIFKITVTTTGVAGIGAYNNANPKLYQSTPVTARNTSNVAVNEYVNLNNVTSFTPSVGSTYIFHSLGDLGQISAINLYLGALLTGGGFIEIKEWGCYNKVLSAAEVIYNTNALNEKYSIF